MTGVLDANAGIEIILNRPKAVHFKGIYKSVQKNNKLRSLQG